MKSSEEGFNESGLNNFLGGDTINLESPPSDVETFSYKLNVRGRGTRGTVGPEGHFYFMVIWA